MHLKKIYQLKYMLFLFLIFCWNKDALSFGGNGKILSTPRSAKKARERVRQTKQRIRRTAAQKKASGPKRSRCGKPIDTAQSSKCLGSNRPSKCSESVQGSIGVNWKLDFVSSGKEKPVFFLPHDNEKAAQTAAQKYVQQNGGTVIMVRCGGQRNCKGVDPNRSFAKDHILREKVFSYFDQVGQSSIITLHSNADGGCLQANNNSSCLRSLGDLTPFPVKGNDPDDFVVLNSPTSANERGRNKELRSYLNENGVSVIHETGKDDGSLSFAATKNCFFYVNLEGQIGFPDKQLENLEVLLQAPNLGIQSPVYSGKESGAISYYKNNHKEKKERVL